MNLDEDFQRELEALKADYRRDIPRQLQRIDELWVESGAGPERLQSLGDLLKCLHTMAGAAGTFGCTRLGAAAAAAEAVIDPWCNRGAIPSAPERAACEELICALRREAVE